MTRRAQIVFSALFVLVIAVPLVLYVAGVRPENVDNRALTSAPSLGGEAVLQQETYAQVDGFLTDRLPFHDRAIRAERSLEDAITASDPVRGEVPRGSDGWLFLPETLVDECAGPPVARFLDAADSVAAARDASAAGSTFLFVVAPDKESIYPQHLPHEGLAATLGLVEPHRPACNLQWEQDLAGAARSRPWMQPLAAELAAASGDGAVPTYYRIDTHWTDAGALHEVRRIVDAASPGLWDDTAVVPGPDRLKYGDLARMRGDAGGETRPGLEIQRPGVQVTVDQIVSGPDDARDVVDISRARTIGAPLIPGTTVIIGDSFGKHSLHLLQPFFEELYYVPWQYLDDHDLADFVPSPADRVVVEQVQRNIVKGNANRFLPEVADYLRREPG